MADNVTANPGTGGDTIAADDISSVKYQRVKLIQGADGVNDGDVSSAAPLNVTLANGTVPSHAVTNAGTFAVQAAQNGTWNVTNVSGTVSLPTGASTAAKQPALGTAGSASTDVISVQGIASMTALKVDGSAVTQPVSGSLTNISGTISLPTGASTSALQTTGNTSVGNIDTTTAALSKAEDAAHSSGDKGIQALAVRNDAGGTLTSADGDYSSLTTDGTGRVWANVTGPNAAYPFYTDISAGGGPLSVGEFGELTTRGAVLTDEGTNRTNFNSTTVGISPGSATFTNGLTAVTGTGFNAMDVHWPQYIKLSADAESAWAQVFYKTDTELTLGTAYTGTGGTGAFLVLGAQPKTGSGGTIAVASGVMTLASGTTATSVTQLTSVINNGSNIFQASFSLDKRIANMTEYAGFEEDITATIKQFARFSFTGTSNTVVTCETGYSPTSAPSANETETTSVTLPGGLTTATALTYKVEMQFEQVIFTINDVVVAQHSKRIPHTATVGNNTLTAGIRLVNGTTPASSTTLTLDYMFTKVYNRIDVYQGNPTIDGGSVPYFVDALTTQVQAASGKGRLMGFSLMNISNAAAWLQVFDTTSSVTLGTTVPIMSFPIPHNSTDANGAGTNFNIAAGINITTGIRIAATTGPKNSTTVSTGLSGTLLYRSL